VSVYVRWLVGFFAKLWIAGRLVRFLIVLANGVGFSFGKCNECFNLKQIFVLY